MATTLLTPRDETCVPPLNSRTGCVFKCQVEPTIASAPSNRQGASEAIFAPCAAIVPSHRTGLVVSDSQQNSYANLGVRRAGRGKRQKQSYESMWFHDFTRAMFG